MAKDKRIKGCPNAECNRNQKKYRYKATDKYCTICGSELVLVCQDCFQKLADMGFGHIRCGSCEAEREDRKHSTPKKLKHMVGKVSNGARSAAQQAKKLGSDLVEDAKSLGDKARRMPKRNADETEDVQPSDGSTEATTPVTE